MKSPIKKTLGYWLFGATLAGTATFVACSPSNETEESVEKSGALTISLQGTDALAIDSVHYVITGPDKYSREGTMDVSKSNTLTGRIGGIPFGPGYSIEFDAEGRGGSASCTGSADFDIKSTGSTKVDVTLQCSLPTKKGSLLVNGSINVCPQIEALDAAPLEVHVGGTIVLSADGTDADEGPSELTYAWSASSGELSKTDTADTTFTCTKAGSATISLVLSDGDTCPDKQTVTVECSVNTAPVTVSFQDGALPTTAYAGTQDATIREARPTDNYGSEDTCEADGDDGNGVDKSCLLRWDISEIPKDSEVTAASITLESVNPSNNTYQLYALLAPWEQTQATWTTALTGKSWAAPGATGSADRGAVIGSVTGGTGSITIELDAAGLAVVQGWVDGTTNAGISIANTTSTDGIDFASSEFATVAQRPKLTVTYVQKDPNADGVSTDPDLKVAFIGDTDHGTNLKNVLNLIVAEKAQALLVQGDMSYSANPDAWWDAVESVLGTDFPIFLSRGNHDDSSWPGYLPRAANHLGGAERVAGAHDANYKTTWRGLVVATIKKGDGPENITPFLQEDPHIWKICQWHQNQRAMQIGGKSDEMGWGVYEACREMGAIVETGHEHSYERTRTLTSTTLQTVDPTCSDPNELCVGPGRTFVNVVGLGGNSVRTQSRCLPTTFPYGCNEEWSFIYASDQNATHGVQFITFNADGKPREAKGYFKDIRGDVVDTFKVRAAAFE